MKQLKLAKIVNVRQADYRIFQTDHSLRTLYSLGELFCGDQWEEDYKECQSNSGKWGVHPIERGILID